MHADGPEQRFLDDLEYYASAPTHDELADAADAFNDDPTHWEAA